MIDDDISTLVRCIPDNPAAPPVLSETLAVLPVDTMASVPVQRAVKLNGVTADAVDLTAEQVLELTNLANSSSRNSSGWCRCQVPALLGIPLAMKQLAPTTTASRPKFEQPAVFLLMDPITGFAPPEVQLNGLGEVLLARTDGKDWTVPELWELHEYNCHLMDRWGDWMEDGLDSAEVQEERQEALSPQGYADYIQMQAGNRQEDEDLEEESEDD